MIFKKILPDGSKSMNGIKWKKKKEIKIRKLFIEYYLAKLGLGKINSVNYNFSYVVIHIFFSLKRFDYRGSTYIVKDENCTFKKTYIFFK